LGGCNYVPLEQNDYLISWLYNGFGHLAVYSFTDNAVVNVLAEDYSRLRHLAVDERFFYCIASHVARGTTVLAIDRKTLCTQVLTELEIALDSNDVSKPH